MIQPDHAAVGSSVAGLDVGGAFRLQAAMRWDAVVDRDPRIQWSLDRMSRVNASRYRVRNSVANFDRCFDARPKASAAASVAIAPRIRTQLVGCVRFTVDK